VAESQVFVPFRFRVSLFSGQDAAGTGQDLLCSGAFSEASGLEATMQPKKIVEGGRNWGELQRAGPTSFSTVTLKRGITSNDHLYTWFDVVTRQANYGYRLTGKIDVKDRNGTGDVLLTFRLRNALPIKFKGPDLSSTSNQVAIEELQLVHEGLTLERASRS
jgi:phage tail-like protein